MFSMRLKIQNPCPSISRPPPTHWSTEFMQDLESLELVLILSSYRIYNFTILSHFLNNQMKSYIFTYSFMIELTSSIVSSTITTCIVYPAERIKLEMHLNADIKSTKQAIRKIIQREGIRGLYTGLSSEIFGNGLSYAIYFVAYAHAKKLLGFNPESFLSITKSSGSAGCVSAIATNPFWVLKTKQAQKGQSIIVAGKNLVRSQGVLALWKGLLASLILVSNPIIQFGIYQLLKKRSPITKQSAYYDLIIFLLGAISKIIATLVTYPYTLIRTKQHVNKDKKLTIYQAFLKEITDNGFTGLYTGMKAKIIQSVLNSAIMLMVYQRTQIFLTQIIKARAIK